jgi:hypothetical protein
MFHALIIQKCVINEQMYFNIYDVFYSQYSPQHVSEQGVRNVEKGVLFAMA